MSCILLVKSVNPTQKTSWLISRLCDASCFCTSSEWEWVLSVPATTVLFDLAIWEEPSWLHTSHMAPQVCSCTMCTLLWAPGRWLHQWAPWSPGFLVSSADGQHLQEPGGLEKTLSGYLFYFPGSFLLVWGSSWALMRPLVLVEWQPWV